MCKALQFVAAGSLRNDTLRPAAGVVVILDVTDDDVIV